MIEGFRSKGLEELYTAGKTRRIGTDSVRKCIRILSLLEAAEAPEDMNVAGLHFHGLLGFAKRWSVRVTANYRMTFGWSKKYTMEIDYEDYH